MCVFKIIKNMFFSRAKAIRFCFFAVFSLSFSLSLNAQQSKFDLLSDSTIKQFPEIEVEAKAEQKNPSLKYNSSTRIESDYYKLISPTQISDIISISPGVFIKNYGGLSAMKTISLRGGAAHHTLIQLDGISLNSSQNSTFDLSLLPTQMIDKISISKGGLSALHGAGAISGVVEINMKSYDEASYKIDSKYGSFNDLSASATASFPYKNTKFSATVEYQGTDGNYPINISQFGEKREVKRENADFKNISSLISGRALFNKSNITGFILLRSSERGSPGAVVQGAIENSIARLKEKDFLSSLKYSYFFNEKNNVSFSIFGKLSNFNYLDLDKFTEKTALTDFSAKDFKINFNYNLIKSSSNFHIGTDFSFSDLTGNMLQKTVGNYVERKTFGLYSNYDTQIHSSDFLSSSAFAGFRFEAVELFSPSFSPLLGTMLSIKKTPLQLKFSISNNYRTPNFNEMYYLNYGSSDLKAEKSFSLNLGASSQVFGFEIGFDLFSIATKNLIVTTAKSPIAWEAANISKALSKGIELALSNDCLLGFINFKLAYTLQKTTDESDYSLLKGKQIVYTPQELLNATIIFNVKEFYLGILASYTSFMYSIADNSNESIIPSNFVASVFLSKEIRISNLKMGLRLEASNLFNAQYELIKNYPMPMRAFKIAVFFEV